MHKPKYCMFFDFHTMPACPDVGENFNVEEFTDRIKECGIDYLTFHARCNMGMAYYDTKIGIKHPSLKYDLFGKIAEACIKKDIALTAYINGGLSHEEAYRNRNWTVVNPDGSLYQNMASPFFRRMCYNSGYGNHLLAMIEEILTNYPVKGLFVDCFDPHNCIGEECMKKMKQEGIDWKNNDELTAFADKSLLDITERISTAARKINPEFLIYFNGVAHEDQVNAGTYLECECLPTGNCDYEYLPLQARYMRTLNMPVINMTGRFHRSWGDFGGIRSEASLEYDCLYGLANGMRPNVGCHYHPRGDINNAVFSLVKNVYKKIQKYEPWFDNAVPLVNTAVVSPVNGKDTRKNPANYGATRMLSELKCQFDVVTEFASWDKYELLVLADDVALTPEKAARIRKHIDAGKPILSTGKSGLDPEGKEFLFSKDWGVSYKEESPSNPAYISLEKNLSKDMPDMPLAVYEKLIVTETRGKTEILARITAPYYNNEWDGEHLYYYAPPDKTLDLPAITLNGKIAHLNFPIFNAYYQSGYPILKKIASKVLDIIHPSPLIKTINLPSYAKIMVTEQPGRRIVHILSYLPEKRGKKVDVIEEPIVLYNVKFSLRCDDMNIKDVYLAPDYQKLDFRISGRYLETMVPEVNGYAMIVFEN